MHSYWLSVYLLLAACVCGHASWPHSRSGLTSWPRPPHSEHAKMARWLAHSSDWGVLATSAADGSPVGGVVSVSDGPEDCPTGRLFFYLTPMDEVAHNIKAQPHCSFTLAEASLPGSCSGTDPEDPTCAKVTLLGSMHPLPPGPDHDAAQYALFSRHPAMAQWPQGHHFQMYELHVKEAHLLDYYGGMAVISREEYYSAELDPGAAQGSWVALGRQQQQQQGQKHAQQLGARGGGQHHHQQQQQQQRQTSRKQQGWKLQQQQQQKQQQQQVLRVRRLSLEAAH